MSREREALALKLVLAVFIKLGTGAVEPQGNFAPRLVACLLDGLKNHLNSSLVAFDAWRKAALIAHRNRQALVMKNCLKGMEDLGAIAQCLTKGGGTHRNDHEFLEVKVVICMGSTVHYVHHRNGQGHGARPPEIAIKRQACLVGGGL